MGVFSMVVERHERVLALRDGAVVGVLEPGRHRRRRRVTYERVDVRPRLGTVAPQEILTADGVSVKVSAVLRWSVADPVAFTATTDPHAVVYLAIQVALREQLAIQEAGELIRAGRAEVGGAVFEAARTAGQSVGIAVADVVVKDIVLPPELRSAYAELVTVRQRAQAQLETARAEAAALRSMANAAKLLDDHPALARLRLVQAAPYGTKIVLTTDGTDPAAG